MNALDALVRRAVVRISAPGGAQDTTGERFWGSGFFVAPGWLLTCAHVVGNGGGDVLAGRTPVDVTDWREHTTPGTVALVLRPPRDPQAPPRSWPLPDLALVRAEGAEHAEGTECLWLSERSVVVPAPVGLYGWSRELGEPALRHGLGEARGEDGPRGAGMLLRGEIPVAGCSGGPVVDMRRGTVIGVSKGRGQGDAGLAVPITALRQLADDRPGLTLLHELLRAHDEYHLGRYQAVGEGGGLARLQLTLHPAGTGGLTPDLRAHLFARLAALPPPRTAGEVIAPVQEARKRVIQSLYQPGVVHDPRLWREGVGLLYELHDGGAAGAGRDLELEAVLLYAAHVAAAVRGACSAEHDAPLRELCAWVTAAAERLPDVLRAEIQALLSGHPAGSAREGRQPADAALADVRVEIDGTVYGSRHAWRVILLRPDGPQYFDGDEQGARREELSEALREPIAAALRCSDVGEHLAALEVAVPRELFDVPFDDWRLSPPGAPEDDFDPHALPLGHRRVVVLRDRRRHDLGATPEWRRRWKGTARGPMTAVPLRREVPLRGHSGPAREGPHAAYARLSDTEDSAVPVYCGPVASGPGAAAMAVALTAGHPVVIWRGRTPEHNDCAEFHEQVARLVAEAKTADGLHRRIRNLRIRCADPELPDPEAHWARSIALLLDPPERTGLPEGPLRAPSPRPAPGR
ncbi:trypsin-like peptidase domain-containing protein [Streptomyces gamaensis]|uniref:Trypsin-like peptidase domain-containing protein n=1 Tax=Streptomyces gamaensis TaxID=1763542 RepID=A0ABW0ZCG8_9ACTN